jgi:hypothetical protein
MYERGHILLVLAPVAILLLLMSAFSAIAQSLELTAHWDQQEYVVGEPMRLRVELKNTSATEVRILEPPRKRPNEGTLVSPGLAPRFFCVRGRHGVSFRHINISILEPEES